MASPLVRVRALLIVLAMIAAGSLFALTSPSPAQAAAPKAPQERGDIVITSDAHFDKDHGVRSGKGTKKDPFVISGWRVSTMLIKDTSKHLVVKDNIVDGQLVLDWNGDRLNVHHNDVSDMRVNQNVPRTGDATDGRIHHNTFDVVGQLRHWDGVFEHNTIGSPTLLAKRGTFEAIQFDGFQGAHFRHNKIYGFVDVKIHGHHHGSGFKKSSHYHGDSGEPGDHSGHVQNGSAVDHTRRYHELFFHDNKIFSDGDYAVRYYDRDHTGDDRTNASETNKNLNCPHVHFTRVHIHDNELMGSGLLVDVFNAFDENHWGTKRGLVDIRDNKISLDRDATDVAFKRHGITIQEAVDVDVHIAENRIDGADMVKEHDLLKLESKLNVGSGILLQFIDEARIYLHDNAVTHREFGIMATAFTKSVKWWVDGLQTRDVAKPIHYDDTVPNAPKQG